MTHMRLGAAEAEYYVRNKQVLQRADEVRMAVDIVSALAQGEQVTNVMPQEMGYSLDGFKGSEPFIIVLWIRIRLGPELFLGARIFCSGSGSARVKEQIK